MSFITKITGFFMKNRPVTINSSYVKSEEILKNKHAIVFGGCSGIGLEICNKLYESGCSVTAVGRSKKELPNYINYFQCDLTNFNAFENNMKFLITNDVDIIINCQGILTDNNFKQSTLDISFEEFDVTLNTNLKSVYFINQFFCKYFLNKKKCGHILNIVSTEGLKGSSVPYGISKAGVASFTKGFGKKYASKGIVINGIAPGATATGMMKSSDKNLRCSYIPSGRMTTTKEIANVALLLVSDMGNNMSGEIIVIDGGESIH